MKKKWIIILGILICCGIVLPTVDWKETIRKFRMFHTEKLILANQSIDETIELVKSFIRLQDEAEDEAVQLEDSYSRFVMRLFASEEYKVSGTERIRAEDSDRTFEFELAVSGENRALREVAGEEIIRTVLSDGTLYQINESESSVIQSSGGIFLDVLTEACKGKIISVWDGSFGGNPVKEYELYYEEAIYKMSFDSNDELNRLQKLDGNTLIEYIYTEFQWGVYDEALFAVDMAAYETITEIYVADAAQEPEAILALPAEYPVNELPLPESSELTSVKANFNADKKGSMMVTYVSGKGMEELKQHYINYLQGSQDYVVSEEIRSGEKFIAFSGQAGDCTVELIEIKYNSTRGQMQVNLLLNK